MNAKNEVVKRGRGRPKKEGSRRKITSIRFDDDERGMIEHLEIETGMNATDIIRKALRLCYSIESNKF